MDTGKERTADLNVGSRLQEVIMFLAIVSFFVVVLYGLYRLVRGSNMGDQVKPEMVQLGIPQRIGDGTLDLKQLLSNQQRAVKEQLTYSLCTKTEGGVVHFIDLRAIDLKLIDSPTIKLEAEVKEPLGTDVFEYIEKNMSGHVQYTWSKPNSTVSVRLCCPMDSVGYYLGRGNGAKSR